MEIVQLPADYRSIVEFRMYIDSVNENLSLHDKYSVPPEYVTLTPILFNVWCEWVEEQDTAKSDADAMRNDTGDGTITPFGTKIAPPWVKYRFNNLEEFYQYYTELLGD